MRIFNLFLCAALLCLMITGSVQAQPAAAVADDRLVTFCFVPQKNIFYSPYIENKPELDRLYALIDEYRAYIVSGEMPVYVDGYCASLPTERENRYIAFIRSNRVKSEMITNAGLLEEHFRTKNHVTEYIDENGTAYKDVVVVTFRLPESLKPKPAPEPEPQPEPTPQPAPEPVVEPQPEPQPEPVEETVPEPVAKRSNFSMDIRTNLLYDAFLLPTLGVEIPVGDFGIKLDGSYSYWGDEHGKVQKIWLLNPEVRWYPSDGKRFYVGAGANFGEYNVYKGMIGGLLPEGTGYQGTLLSAGATVGYRLHLSHSISLDFNLGLGYSKFDYSSFNVIDRVRIYKEKGQTKEFWGPMQAGISLVWMIGGE